MEKKPKQEVENIPPVTIQNKPNSVNEPFFMPLAKRSHFFNFTEVETSKTNYDNVFIPSMRKTASLPSFITSPHEPKPTLNSINESEIDSQSEV